MIDKYFQDIADILQKIEKKITPETDVIWTSSDSPKLFLNELKEYIKEIRSCNFITLEKIKLAFSPTSNYQELAISNGWSEEYLDLASDFDKIYQKIKNG